MRMMHKAALVASAMIAPALIAVPATAQVAAGQSVAVVDVEGAINNSAAFKAATGQIQTTYKAQIDAFNARNTALNAELAPLQNEIRTLQQNPSTPAATLEARVNAYRTRAQSAQAELSRLAQPFGRPTAYAREQVGEKFEQALKAAMTAKRVNLVLNPENVVGIQPAANITPDVVAQIDALVKTVSVTPPANWQPGQPASAAARPATPPAGGR